MCVFIDRGSYLEFGERPLLVLGTMFITCYTSIKLMFFKAHAATLKNGVYYLDLCKFESSKSDGSMGKE